MCKIENVAKKLAEVCKNFSKLAASLAQHFRVAEIFADSNYFTFNEQIHNYNTRN